MQTEILLEPDGDGGGIFQRQRFGEGENGIAMFHSSARPINLPASVRLAINGVGHRKFFLWKIRLSAGKFYRTQLSFLVRSENLHFELAQNKISVASAARTSLVTGDRFDLKMRDALRRQRKIQLVNVLVGICAANLE